MDEDLKEVNEQIKELSANLTKYRDQVDEIEKRGGGTSEIKEAIDKLGADLAEQYVSKQAFEALAKQKDELETRIEGLKQVQKEAGVEPDEHRKAIRDFFRTAGGDPNVGPMKPETLEFFSGEKYMKFVSEIRTLTEGTSTAGGLFVDPVIEEMILKNVVDIDPVRSVAQVMTITMSDRQKGYRRTGTPSATWETETGSGSDSESTWAPYEIPAHPLVGKTQVSGDLLADVSFIEQEVTADMGQQFSYTEGVAFVEGNGVSRPMGFTTNVGVDDNIYPATVTSTGAAGSDAIQANDISKMWGTLKAPYRAGAIWAFNSTTFISLLQLKDANNRYFLNVDGGLIAGPPDTMYGRPFTIMETLPDEGSDVYPLWFGNLKLGYRIVDRSGIQILRDEYTVWPKVYFKMRKRVGGQVILAEAIKGLKTS